MGLSKMRRVLTSRVDIGRNYNEITFELLTSLDFYVNPRIYVGCLEYCYTRLGNDYNFKYFNPLLF